MSDAADTSGLAGPEIYLGGQPPLATRSASTITELGNEEFTFNFANADIREVVNEILGTALGISYVVDPRVQGSITLRSARPLKRSDLLGLLEDVLAMNGAALVPEGDQYRIIPLAEAVSSPAILEGGPMPRPLERGYGLHVFPLKFASATALLETLQPLAPPGGVLRVDPERNLVILAGTSSQAQDFGSLLDLFDVDWMQDKSFGLFPLENASAENVSTELRRIFGEPGQDAEGEIIEFVPITRLNAILAITSQESYVERVRVWVQRLDRGIEGDLRQLHVYFVQNGRAQQLAEVVGKALSAEVTRGSQEDLQQRDQSSLEPGFGPQDDAGPADVEGVPPDGQELTEPTLRRSDSEELIAPDIGITGAAPSAPETALRIVADTRNNALLIYATATEYALVKSAIEKLDIIPLQVMIEATIAEVTLTDELRYGLQWFFHAGDSNFTFSPLASGAVAPIFPGFNYALTSSNAQVILNALTQITDVKVISSPQLMVLNNETARLQVGDQVPIATQEVQSIVDSDAPIVNSIEYRDTGVILSVSPRVNSGGLVVLDIVQEVSDVVSTTTSELNSPTIQQRRIKSTVAVQSGESVALGGLIRDGNNKGVTGIPVVSEIPLLGNLFKTTTNTQRRTELLVLLTPRVATSRQDAREITEELRSRVRALAPLEYRVQ